MGSEFTILIPAVTDHVITEPVDFDELLKPKIHKDTAGKVPDVLLVEDNTVNLQLLMVYLKEYCNIYSALDGKSAIEMAQEHPFDAILMDINLGPGMDGIQAMLEIRKRQGNRDIPIIAVTGYASIGDRDRLLSTGFSEYLPKPFTREKIAEMMEGLFTRKG
jgi:CheY-like chemotaxis protein